MVLDSRFLLMWLMPVVVSFFAVEVRTSHNLLYVLEVAFYGFLVFYLFYFLLNFIKYKSLIEFLKNTMLVLSLLFAFVDFFLSRYFNIVFTSSVVNTILATNFRESRDFFVDMVFPHRSLIFGFVVFCAFFLYRVHWVVRLSKNIHAVLIAMFTLGVSLHVIALICLKVNILKGVNQTINYVIPVVKEGHAIYASLKEYAKSQVIIQNLKQPIPKDYLSMELNSVPNVVLIIGESASKNFMGLYGYPVPNTPFLSGLQERERERERDHKTCSSLKM